jgi:hypothetical protein
MLVRACLAGALLLAGCGDKKSATPAAGDAAAPARESAPPATPKPVAVRTESAGQLPPVDPLTGITVDGGRVKIFSPQGWARAPRSSDYLIRYVPKPQQTHPAVTVFAGDPPGGIASVTAENHTAFVATLADALADAGRGPLLKPPAAIELGSHRGATWVTGGEAKVSGLTQPVERGGVAVVVGGRLYTVEAEAPKGRIDAASRAAARAVAAAIEAVQAEPAVEPAVAPEPEPAAEPEPQ